MSDSVYETQTIIKNYNNGQEEKQLAGTEEYNLTQLTDGGTERARLINSANPPSQLSNPTNVPPVTV